MGYATSEHWMALGVNITLIILVLVGVAALVKWMKNKKSDPSAKLPDHLASDLISDGLKTLDSVPKKTTAPKKVQKKLKPVNEESKETRLKEAKDLYKKELINEIEYEKLKKQILGLD